MNACNVMINDLLNGWITVQCCTGMKVLWVYAWSMCMYVHAAMESLLHK